MRTCPTKISRSPSGRGRPLAARYRREGAFTRADELARRAKMCPLYWDFTSKRWTVQESKLRPVARFGSATLRYLRPLPPIARPADGGEQHRRVPDIVVISSADGDRYLIAGAQRIPVDPHPLEPLDVEPNGSTALSAICSDDQLDMRVVPLDLLYLASERETVAALHLRRMMRCYRACDTESQDHS